MKTPTKVPTSLVVSSNLIKNPRIAASADDLSDYLETSRDFPNENIDPNTTATLKEEVRLNPNLVTSPLGSVSNSPSLNLTPDSRRRLQNFHLRNISQQKSNHGSPVLVEKVKKMDSIVPRRRSVSSSSTLDDSRSQIEGKIIRAESIEAVAVSQLDPNHNLTPEAQLRVLNYEYRGPLPAKHHCQRSLFHSTAATDSPQPETPKRSKPIVSKKPTSVKSQAEVDKKVFELKKENEKLMDDVRTLKTELDIETRQRKKVETQLQKSKKDSEVERQLYMKEASKLHQRHQKEMENLSKEKEKEFKNLLESKLKLMESDLEAKAGIIEDYSKKLVEAEDLAEEYRQDLILLQEELSSYQDLEIKLREKADIIRELESQLEVVRNELEGERRVHEDEVDELRRQHYEEMEFLNFEKENELMDRLGKQVELMKVDFDERLKVVSQELERTGESGVNHSQELESQIENLRNELENERKKYLDQIEELRQKHEEEMSLLSVEKEKEYNNRLDEELKLIKSQFDEDLKAASEEFEKKIQDGVLHREEVKTELQNLKEELKNHRQKYLNEIEELKTIHQEETRLLSLKKEEEYRILLEEQLQLMKKTHDADLKAAYEQLEENNKDEVLRFEELGLQLQNMRDQLEKEHQNHLDEMEKLQEKYQKDIEILSVEKEDEYKVQLNEQLEFLKNEFESKLKSKYEEFDRKEQDRILRIKELEYELQNIKDQLEMRHQKYLKEVAELHRKYQEEMNALSQKKEKEYNTVLDGQLKAMKIEFDSKLKTKCEKLEKDGNNGLVRCQELETELDSLKKQLDIELQKHLKEVKDLQQQHKEEIEFLCLDKEHEFEVRLNAELSAYRISQERLDEHCRDLEEKLNNATLNIPNLNEHDNSDGEDSGFGSNTQTPRKEEPVSPEVEQVTNDSRNVYLGLAFISLLLFVLVVMIISCISIDGRIYIPFGFSFYPRLEYVRTPPM